MKGFYLAITFVVVLISISLPASNANTAFGNAFADPTSDQFHIQTDEGPERYFRYQTHSGQYRKEKRLEDGTVVGSYGWIDSTGLLRLRDYIADNAGYRILRTKDVYVGRNRPIAQAIKAAKKVPGSNLAGVAAPGLYLPPVTTPSPTASPLPSGFVSSPPRVDILHNSYPSTTAAPPVTSTLLPPTFVHHHSSTPAAFEPAVTATPATVVIAPKTPFASYLPSSTVAPPIVVTTHRPPFAFSSTPHPLSSTASSLFYDHPSSIAPPINSNALDYFDSSENPYLYHNGPTYPIDRNGNLYYGRAQNRQTVPGNNAITAASLGNGYDAQYPLYDGVSVTNDGFRYYIPRAYHEEQSDNGGYSKAGSFGYIDPFGIRRVVYYNAGPNGFQHRKNNRYVGFNATPYDPRPYKKKK